MQSIASVVNRRWKTYLLEENRLNGSNDGSKWRNQEGLRWRYRSAGGGGSVVHSIAGASVIWGLIGPRLAIDRDDLQLLINIFSTASVIWGLSKIFPEKTRFNRELACDRDDFNYFVFKLSIKGESSYSKAFILGYITDSSFRVDPTSAETRRDGRSLLINRNWIYLKHQVEGFNRFGLDRLYPIFNRILV